MLQTDPALQRFAPPGAQGAPHTPAHRDQRTKPPGQQPGHPHRDNRGEHPVPTSCGSNQIGLRDRHWGGLPAIPADPHPDWHGRVPKPGPRHQARDPCTPEMD